MSDEAFKELIGHDITAPNVVIMSVVIEPVYLDKGYANKMMNHVIKLMREAGKNEFI